MANTLHYSRDSGRPALPICMDHGVHVLQMDSILTVLMTGRHRKINNFICGLIYDFDPIVNCDKLISDQRRFIVRHLYLRVATEVTCIQSCT